MTAIHWPLWGEITKSKKKVEVRPSSGLKKVNVLISIGLIIFAVVIAVVGFQNLLISEQYGIDKLDERLQYAIEREQVLRSEVARLESPDRILSEAQGRLGMVPPPARIYLSAVIPGDSLESVPPPRPNPFSRSGR
ncbi:MAG: Cell division protein FtsL [Acidimicrobiales bacterium AG-410-I20]|nr:MAG: Cell division protein FtsL [Acidimicrobiales bacterium AG-410-I20]